MHFCPCLRKLHTTSSKPPKFDIPLMDLSSLEGPPIDNPRLRVPPNPTNPRIHIHSPPPDTSITNILVWKPLPPAPTSTDNASQRQYQRRNDWPSGPSLDPNLRQSPAHRGGAQVHPTRYSQTITPNKNANGLHSRHPTSGPVRSLDGHRPVYPLSGSKTKNIG